MFPLKKLARKELRSVARSTSHAYLQGHVCMIVNIDTGLSWVVSRPASHSYNLFHSSKQIMVCCLPDTKLLPEPMSTFWKLDL